VIITCTGDSKFFFGFFRREQWAQKRGSMFDFEPGTDKTQDTGRYEISMTYDYYLVIRKSLWHSSPVRVEVKIKVEKP